MGHDEVIGELAVLTYFGKTNRMREALKFNLA